jgi:peptide chain release factor subunit 1
MDESVQNPERARYDFKKAMEEIKDLRGRGTELISVYVPPSKQISEVAAYLRNEYSQSSNIKSKGTKKAVMGAIESILSRLKYFRHPPEHGLVFFVGEIPTSGDQTKMVQFTLEPPEPITTFLYRCDSSFYTEPLLDMLADKKAYGLIVVDRSEATIGLLIGKRVQVIRNIQSLVPSKHGKGGQSAQRFERLIEIAAHEYFKKVANTATEAFLELTDLQGILIGGPGATKEFFAKEEYLHHELQKKIIDTFDTGYTDEYGLKELVENAKDSIQDMDLMREKKLIQQLLAEIRKLDGGLAAYGEDQVRRALEIGAVDTLLLSEGMNRKRVTLKCPCGVEESVTVERLSDDPKCSVCGGAAEVVEEKDLVDDFYDVAATVGTSIELISADSEEGEMLLKAFGGIAALLRFRTGLD